MLRESWKNHLEKWTADLKYEKQYPFLRDLISHVYMDEVPRNGWLVCDYLLSILESLAHTVGKAPLIALPKPRPSEG